MRQSSIKSALLLSAATLACVPALAQAQAPQPEGEARQQTVFVTASPIRDSQAACGMRSDIGAADAAIMLTSLVQGVAIRWTLGARRFSLVQEGLRLFDVQMALMRLTRDTPHD